MKLAPIALFVYNRPWHTRQTVEALLLNDGASESDLFIYADGCRKNQQADSVQQVREYIRTVNGFRSVTIVEREGNLGLARSIISGVNEVLSRFDTIIVLEDDLVTSPYFLNFMNEALRLYSSDQAVVSIHGYVYPVAGELPESFFLKGADCWGWGTWRRGWRHFEPDGRRLLQELQARRLERAFDMDGAYPFTRLLIDQISGRNDSWAIRWHASALLCGGLTLYPGRSLVRNIGQDASGTHCKKSDCFESALADHRVSLQRIHPVESRPAFEAIRDYLVSLQPASRRLLRNVLRKFRFSSLLEEASRFPAHPESETKEK